MSKLEELIQKLCTNGVEYTKLADLIKKRELLVVTPTVKVKRNDYRPYGKTPIISQELEYISGYSDLADSHIPNGEYICFGDHSEHIKYINFSFVQGADGLKIIKSTSKKLELKYFYYAICNYYVKHNNYERHFKYFADTIIPVPPIEVQEEIVRILDKFTELSAELSARKKQYEFYRDEQLRKSDAQIVTLKDICTNYDAKRRPITKNKRVSGLYPYYGASGIVDYVKDFIFDDDYLLVSEDGANLLSRVTPIAFSISGKTWVNNHAHILKFQNYITQRYVEIYLNSIDLAKYISTAAQPKLTQENLNKIEIPLPPLEEQNRIVAILDRFDKICNDISEGLPAEIEARQKQYEYYREKLLQFRIKN